MEIVIRKGRPEELDLFVELLLQVRSGMEEQDWFYVDSPGEFRELMDSGTMHFWFAMDGDRVAGALDILTPGTEPYNYGYELGYGEEELLCTVNMDAAAVHPDYRGLGLQRKLLQTAEEWLCDGRTRILLCTVHPENRFSLNNALAMGYEIRRKISIYGSVRYLLKKEIRKM